MENSVIPITDEADTTITKDISQYLQDSLEILMQLSNHEIDGSKICNHWLKDREYHLLNDEEVEQYQRILIILKDIGSLMDDVKATIQCNRSKNQEIFEKVSAILVAKLKLEPDQVTPTVNFINDLKTDSLDTLELVIALEDAFKIKISNEVSGKLLTVQQIVDYICQKHEVSIET
ncbi:acyl carrier protein [Fischerella sp. JS2]|uniref:acyl carrier protein n=1 Tax=Fischerella sp. JS2 TaxID=2597771 RepID=UPI0037BF2684